MSFRNTKTPLKPTTTAKWQVPMRPNAKSGAKEYYLEGELKERFCQLFPKNSNRRLMAWFGISFSTLQRFKREFCLEKDMRSIRKQRPSTPLEIYTATIATMQKYASLTEDQVNNQSYSLVLEHLERLSKENEEMERIRKK